MQKEFCTSYRYKMIVLMLATMSVEGKKGRKGALEEQITIPEN